MGVLIVNIHNTYVVVNDIKKQKFTTNVVTWDVTIKMWSIGFA